MAPADTPQGLSFTIFYNLIEKNPETGTLHPQTKRSQRPRRENGAEEVSDPIRHSCHSVTVKKKDTQHTKTISLSYL